jgi:hypothetical protein
MGLRLTDAADGERVTADERIALLLTARLLESGVTVHDPPDLGDAGGHVDLALALAGRLARVAGGGDQARQIVASLRSAAGGVAPA